MSDIVLQTGMRLLFVSLASVLSIIVWSRTRNIAWMFMVVGTIASYGDILYSAIDLLGLGGEISTSIWARMVLQNLPYLFYSFGFIAFLRDRFTR